MAVISEAKASFNPRVPKQTAIAARAITVATQVDLAGLCFPLIDGISAREKLKQATIITTSCQIISNTTSSALPNPHQAEYDKDGTCRPLLIAESTHLGT